MKCTESHHTSRPVNRIQATLAFIAAKPLVRAVRAHGNPCRWEHTHDSEHGLLRVASIYGNGHTSRWVVETLALTGDHDTDRETVLTWLGY